MSKKMRRLRYSALTSVSALVCASVWLPIDAQADPLEYKTLDFGSNETFLTGIRADNIVGNYAIPGDSPNTGGILYRSDTEVWSAYPTETGDGVNFPGAISASPYGPSFGSQGGILRVVGSYKTSESNPDDLAYLYDSAATPGEELTTLQYPVSGVKFTIAHSNFGNTVVGNYDTNIATGNAFIYDIPTGAYTTLVLPESITGPGGAVSTTAYGVWGDKIAGGFGNGPLGEPGFETGYIYDMSDGTATAYSHSDYVFTHFEGITGDGKGGYIMVADLIDASGDLQAAVLHVDENGVETWTLLDVPGAMVTSANSAHQGKVIGIYTDADGVHGYEVVVPGIYAPAASNATLLTSNTPGSIVLGVDLSKEGYDILNDGTVQANGASSIGIQSGTYGVVYNNGGVEVTGPDSAGVEMQGKFGVLLNGGTIFAAPGSDAIRAGDTAEGSLAVNYGVIDGRIDFMAGPYARFENSGLIYISAEGAGTIHEFSGVFAQTATGGLGLRIGGDQNDSVSVEGAVRLAGTIAPIFYPGDLANSYRIMTATNEVTGTFETLETYGLASFVAPSLAYSDTAVDLELTSRMALVGGLSANQHAVGDGLDNAFNRGGGIPDGLNAALFGLSEGQLPLALNAVSGEIYASQQSVLINEALFAREAMLDRLREDTLDDQDAAVWAQGLGIWSEFDGNGNVSDISSAYGGIFAGVDIGVGERYTIGVAAGYSRSSTEIDDLMSSADTQTGLIGAYAGAEFGLFNLRGGGSYAFSSIDVNRTIFFPGFMDRTSSGYNANTGQIFGEIGYDATVGGIPIEPYAGLAWAHLGTDGFAETGGSAALTSSGSSSSIGYSTLGVRFSTDHVLSNGMKVSPHFSAAWQHAFSDVTPYAELALANTWGSAFTISGAPLARNAALLEAGLDFELGASSSLGLSYFGQVSDDLVSTAVRADFRWQF
ncbi:autotransporter domain-containing protein [Hoeflea sp. CAU 1731]